MKTLLIIAAAAAAYYVLSNRRQRPVQDDGRPLADDVLAKRVRQSLDGVIGDAERLDIRARQGVVSMSGRVAKGERDRALAVVLAVPGVMEVINYLEPAAEPGEAISLRSASTT